MKDAKRKGKNMEDEKTEVAESSTADETVESSTTEETPTAEETAKKTEENVPFHEHPRWKEKQDELKRERDRAERLEQQSYHLQQELLKRSSPVSREDDLPPGTDDQTKEWVNRFLNPIIEKRVAAQLKEKEEMFSREIGSVRNAYGQLAANEFLKEHTDVKRGSDEMNLIISKAKATNVDLDDAYKIIMFDKRDERVREEERKRINSLNQKKVAANVETKSIPSGSLKPGQKSDREIFEEELKKAGASFD